MTVSVVLVAVLVLCASASFQQIRFLDNGAPYNPNSNYTELPAGVVIPGPESEQVMSEMHEPDRNRTGIFQWILGLAGITTPPTPSASPPANCSECVCGKTNTHKRIVGGQETQVNEYPWMVLLKYGGTFYCGGALINDRYVMTAAHCVNGFARERMSAVLMEHDRDKPDETTTVTRKIRLVVRHPKYNTRNYDNDIALLRLSAPVALEGATRPVCLPAAGTRDTFAGQDGITTGWGAVEEAGPLAARLQEVTVPIISNDDCRKTKYGATRITDNMLCAGLPEGTKDSCQGDSGGPLHTIKDATYYEVGVVSWGQGCAQPDYPGVYTRVTNYLDWIKANTVDACYC